MANDIGRTLIDELAMNIAMALGLQPGPGSPQILLKEKDLGISFAARWDRQMAELLLFHSGSKFYLICRGPNTSATLVGQKGQLEQRSQTRLAAGILIEAVTQGYDDTGYWGHKLTGMLVAVRPQVNAWDKVFYAASWPEHIV